MDFFVLILFSVFVYLIPGNDKDYLAVQSTSGMKGIMAIMIIFHHISQHVTTGITFSNFNYMGWYIVSVFFFLSGYGLYTQFTIKDNYLYNFFKKRVFKLLYRYLLLIIIYLIYRVIKGENINFQFFINLFRKNDTIIYYGWFINAILILYITFYISFKFTKYRENAILINISLSIFYIWASIYFQHGAWEYVSIMSFNLGMIWSEYKQKIDRCFSNNYFLSLMFFSILIYVFQNYDILLKLWKITDRYFYYGVMGNLCNIVFIIYFFLVIKNISFDNKYLKLLGKISFELYMIHGLIMDFLLKYFVSSKLNDVLFTLGVLILSVSVAWLINVLIRFFGQLGNIVRNDWN